MALFSQNMLEIAVELALAKPVYVDMCYKFFEHFMWISSSMAGGENAGMWDDDDGFFYDVLRLPDGGAQRLKVRSMVGLLPLCAVTIFEGQLREKYPEISARFQGFLEGRGELLSHIHNPLQPGYAGRLIASILNEERLRRVLSKMLDENEFLSPYGIRSLSKFHANNPFVFNVGKQEYRVPYVPGESDSGMFGGNSNWRGPIWMPVNGLIIRALLQYYTYYGNEFRIECPTGSGKLMNLYEVAADLAQRLSNIFLQDGKGQRAVYGRTRKFQDDPHWRDLIQFFEYFHGDNGAGLGANHQTGWTGAIARIVHMFATVSAEKLLEGGKTAAIADGEEVKVVRRSKSLERGAPARH
jgi:hypothetical protein